MSNTGMRGPASLTVESNAPIFIVGCPRSGTGLLRDLLRAHPRLTFPHETHFIPLFYRAYGDPKDAGEACRLGARILKLRWIRELGLALEAEAFADCRSFREVVCFLFEAWARKENKPRWGDKTPQYVRHIPLLLKLFPGARILHIYRDGRDVALSSLRAQFMSQNVYVAAKLWKEFVTTGQRAGALLPPGSYMEVCYEQLLQQPSVTMRRVCEFVGEPFDEAVLRPNPDKNGIQLNPFVRGHKPAAEILLSNFNKWKTRMTAKDRVLFESVAGDLLEELNYETEGQTRRISALESLGWALHQRFWWFAVRAKMLGSEAFFSSYARLIRASLRARFRPA